MTITKEQLEFITSLYKNGYLPNNNVLDLFEEEWGVRISIQTLKSIKKRENLPTCSHGGCRRGLSEKEFRDLYSISRGNIEEMVICSGLGVSTITNRCDKYGLSYHNIPKRDFNRSPKKRALHIRSGRFAYKLLDS